MVASNVLDKLYDTAFAVTSGWADQWLMIESYCGSVTFNGVLLETSENNLISGTVEFFVDEVKCPNTNSVGVNAVGGIFNCGLSGTRFQV